MQHFTALERFSRLRAAVAFVTSAAAVAYAIHIAGRSPALALLLVGLVALTQLPAVLRHAQFRRLLRSGNLPAVLSAYSPVMARMPYPETFGPLMVAVALAAHGMTERARRALDRAVRGDAWEAALEHRWFIETLVDAFDGDRDRALERAESIERLPLPRASASLTRRIVALRSALSALARAFARRSRPGDAELLERTSERSPLVHWAMRYAAAVAYLEQGDRRRAGRLLDGAPRWPEDCAFRFFQEELASLANAPAESA